MNTKVLGNKGEDIAALFLEGKGFVILNRNYLKKWGELDIVAQKAGVIHFFEVKTVTYRPSLSGKGHSPEENVHGLKVRSIRRMVETYLSEFNVARETAFQFHVLCVYMDPVGRRARVKWIENVIL